MSNEILYILLPDYAAHEAVYLSQAVASDDFAMKENPKYVNKVVAPTLEPVKSIGGFRTVPDYSFDTMPDDYAALVLIGGFGWRSGDFSAKRQKNIPGTTRSPLASKLKIIVD